MFYIVDTLMFHVSFWASKILESYIEVEGYEKVFTMHHILTQFSGHTLFDNNSACHLLPDVKLLSGHLYYLVPKTTKKKKTKKVTFADHEVKEDARLLAKRSCM